MSDLALTLARQARRAGLRITLLQWQRRLTLEQLDVLLRRSKYRSELASITITELRRGQPTRAQVRANVEQRILDVFTRRPSARLSSGYFTRHLRLHRWTAQGMLAKLAERGVLVREGKTSGTRYQLAPHSRTRGG